MEERQTKSCGDCADKRGSSAVNVHFLDMPNRQYNEYIKNR